MTISDDTLMAYADGELDAAARAAVESAMREDPQIERRVAAHRSLRQRVHAAYSPELSEEVPERLLRAVREGASIPGSKVVNLEDARAAAIERKAALARALPPPWRTAGAIAASVIVGVGLGFFMWGRTESPLMRSAGGALVARGPLVKALSDQLAAEQSESSPVKIGVSFLAKSGDYCRSFALAGAVSPAGLACHHGGEWQVELLTEGSVGAAGNAGYRTAGSGIPEPILKEIEGQRVGEPLDQAAERVARSRGWSSNDR